MINFIVWVIIGDISGLVASIIMRTDVQQGMPLNMIVGIVGAALVGLMLGLLFRTSTSNQNNLSLSAPPISLTGAIIFIGMGNLFGLAREQQGGENHV